MTSLSPPSQQEEPHSQNPNSNQDDQNPQSPHTLEQNPHPQNPDQSDPNQTQSQEDPQHNPEQSGMSSSSPSSRTISIPPITVPHDPNPPPPPPTLTSPTPRRPIKRKKGNKKKQRNIGKKLETLISNLKPIPFVPSKTLDFNKHEKLLKKLGLWDFVHTEFDRNVRIDLLAQLIAKYDPRSRCSYVNDCRIQVNRADLARAFKLPVKKDKAGSGNVSVSSSEAVDLDSEALSEESIGFMEDFLSNWVLLHEDTWMMPGEVLNWTRAIKDGCPEKVDWAGVIWFMVEKELLQGQQLVDCYYASHLQYLMKTQREEVFWEEDKVEEEVEVKEEEDGGGGDVKMGEEIQESKVEAEEEVVVKEEEEGGVGDLKEEEGGVGDLKIGGFDEIQGQMESEENVIMGELSVELTLGQESGEKEEVKDGEIMEVEESKEEEVEEEQGQWLLDGKNSLGDHFLQRCDMQAADVSMDGDEERKPEVEEEVEEEEVDEEDEDMEDDGFNHMPKGITLESDMLTGNLLQRMESTHMSFGLPGEIGEQSNLELLASRTEARATSGGSLIFGNGTKREISHEDDLLHESLNGNNKRLRTDGPWSDKSSEFEICMEQMEHLMGKARMMYQTKVQAFEESSMSQQFLLSEMQRRDHLIEHLRKTIREEGQKKDGEIYRLERELYLMGNLLEGYRKAVKETHKAFSEYRQQCQLPEEPLYKDAGPGGVVLSTMELEKQRLKQEEEDRLNRIVIEQKVKEVEEELVSKLEAHFNEVQKLDKQLMNSENEVKMLKELSAKSEVLPKTLQSAPNDD